MKIKNNRTVIVLLFVLSLLFTAGCKKTEDAPPQPAPKGNFIPKAAPVQTQQTSSFLRPAPSQTADFSARKDPFKPFVVETKPAKLLFRRGSRIGLLPIQNYELSQFKILGVVAGLSALVVDPAGKGYVVKPGMEIGKNGGHVQNITAASIDVLEKYQDQSGKIRKRTVRLALPRKD